MQAEQKKYKATSDYSAACGQSEKKYLIERLAWSLRLIYHIFACKLPFQKGPNRYIHTAVCQ